MIFKKREYLTLLQYDKKMEKISLESLKTILEERPADIIYIEVDGCLNGLISMGDIRRAHCDGEKAVKINTNFTKINRNQYMKALEIFKRQETILAIPVVDDYNCIVGEYLRCDDMLWISRGVSFLQKNDVREKKKIALVTPSSIFVQKQEGMNNYLTTLQHIGFDVCVVDFCSLEKSYDTCDFILYVDSDELKGKTTLLESILNKEFDQNKSYTFLSFEKMMVEERYIDLLRELVKLGVHVFTVNFKNTPTKYMNQLICEIGKKYDNTDINRFIDGNIHKVFSKDFFDEIYSDEYANEISKLTFPSEIINGVVYTKDQNGKYLNISNSERLTINQPKCYTQTIYFFGGCIIVGNLCEDKHTIESALQNKINEIGDYVRVVNYGGFNVLFSLLRRMESIKFCKGDIIVTYIDNREFDGIQNINLIECLEQNTPSSHWFTNHPSHCNYKINEMYADDIYKRIKCLIHKDRLEETICLKEYLVNKYLDIYFGDQEFDETSTVGAIVMNCNPFTIGHKYLIEEARKQCDYLIIFVVEEDKSLFSFQMRMTMVREGTKELNNIKIVPSGKFILSQANFPEYFIKIEDKDVVNNAEYDIKLFAEHIATRLRITKRFVGDEKNDPVTFIYNEAMKKILPDYGIKLVEIPRKATEGNIVSASLVRKSISEYDFEKVGNMIPDSTKEIMFANIM